MLKSSMKAPNRAQVPLLNGGSCDTDIQCLVLKDVHIAWRGIQSLGGLHSTNRPERLSLYQGLYPLSYLNLYRGRPSRYPGWPPPKS